jgi:Ca2+ transporting ATPase
VVKLCYNVNIDTISVGVYFRCNFILDCEGKPKPFSVEDQENIVKNVIEPMAGDGLRTICIAYKDFHSDAG